MGGGVKDTTGLRRGSARDARRTPERGVAAAGGCRVFAARVPAASGLEVIYITHPPLMHLSGDPRACVSILLPLYPHGPAIGAIRSHRVLSVRTEFPSAEVLP